MEDQQELPGESSTIRAGWYTLGACIVNCLLMILSVLVLTQSPQQRAVWAVLGVLAFVELAMCIAIGMRWRTAFGEWRKSWYALPLFHFPTRISTTSPLATT
jgi:hypothetical protein